jgi:hypothetical protein
MTQKIKVKFGWSTTTYILSSPAFCGYTSLVQTFPGLDLMPTYTAATRAITILVPRNESEIGTYSASVNAVSGVKIHS